MLFQYLVGLFTLKHGGGLHFNVILGDLVFDEASGTKRDVDVTVSTPDGEVYAFAGYEVKHWTVKLDVSDVEALAVKLKDMPDVTHRAIVCSSGYTAPAIKKAKYHGVDLYVIKEWTTPIEEQFPDLAPMKGPPSEVFRGNQFHLTWPERNVYLHVPGPYFEIAWDEQLFDSEGKKHAVYPDFAAFSDGMLIRSTDILCLTKPMLDRVNPEIEALTTGGSITMPEPRWPFGHTFEVANADVYVRASDNELHRVDIVTIQGQLCWEYSPMLYLAVEKVPTGEKFASAMVGVSPIPGRMLAIMMPTSGRNLSIRNVVLNRDQLNAIRLMEISPPEDISPKPVI
jgi:hypothetical protein